MSTTEPHLLSLIYSRMCKDKVHQEEVLPAKLLVTAAVVHSIDPEPEQSRRAPDQNIAIDLRSVPVSPT